ncbi:MAG: hypothetical protein ACHP8A_20040, partial [Terriglobales bacterium]
MATGAAWLKQELTGWKRRRKTFLQGRKRKTYLTLTGLLMEGVGRNILTLLFVSDSNWPQLIFQCHR